MGGNLLGKFPRHRGEERRLGILIQCLDRWFRGGLLERPPQRGLHGVKLFLFECETLERSSRSVLVCFERALGWDTLAARASSWRDGNQKPSSNIQGLTLKAVRADTGATIGELEINVMVTMFVHPSVLFVIILVQTRLDMMESN